MRQAAMMRAGAAGYCFGRLSGCMAAGSGDANSAHATSDRSGSSHRRAGRVRHRPQAVTGGKLHGVVKSGNIPLPGVTVTAQNTLTGKRYSTTTDITGAWPMKFRKMAAT